MNVAAVAYCYQVALTTRGIIHRRGAVRRLALIGASARAAATWRATRLRNRRLRRAGDGAAWRTQRRIGCVKRLRVTLASLYAASTWRRAAYGVFIA
jgi:hypothetical protein